MFDENFTKKTLFQFQLGQGQVIPGWDQGLEGMKVGGTRRLVIPSNLAYGAEAPGSIPANLLLCLCRETGRNQTIEEIPVLRRFYPRRYCRRITNE